MTGFLFRKASRVSVQNLKSLVVVFLWCQETGCFWCLWLASWWQPPTEIHQQKIQEIQIQEKRRITLHTKFDWQKLFGKCSDKHLDWNKGRSQKIKETENWTEKKHKKDLKRNWIYEEEASLETSFYPFKLYSISVKWIWAENTVG